MKTTLRARLIALVGFLSLLSVGIGALGLHGIDRANQALRTVYLDRTLVLQQLAIIDHLLMQTTLAVATIEPSRTAHLVAEVDQNLAEISDTWEQYLETYITPAERILADRFAESYATLLSDALWPTLEALRAQELELAGRLQLELQTVAAGTARELEALRQFQVGVAEMEYRAADARYGLLQIAVLTSIALGSLAAVFSGYVLIRNIYRQLGGELSYAASVVQSIGAGNLNVAIQLKPGDRQSLLYALSTMQQKLAEKVELIQTNERRTQAIIRNASEAFVGMDASGKITDWNEQAEQTFGWSRAAVIGRDLAEVIIPERYRQRHRSGLVRFLATGDGALLNHPVELEGLHRNGREFPVEMRLSVIRTDDVYSFFAFLHDITERRMASERLLYLAQNDQLTGLPNRSAFHERLGQEMARTRRSRRPIAVMYLDIDHFKSINDTLGHRAGDELLKCFAERLKECVREADMVARLGGDEFTVLIEELQHPNDAEVVAAKIVQKVAAGFPVLSQYIRVSTSVGIALYYGEDINYEQLLSEADHALYAAKRAGRNTFRMAARAFQSRTTELHPAAVRAGGGIESVGAAASARGEPVEGETVPGGAIAAQFATPAVNPADRPADGAAKGTESPTSQVIDKDKITTVYQPIYDLDQQKVIGFEALTRFLPESGRTPASWFEEMAKAGRLAELETLAIEKAKASLDLLPPSTFISLNVSPGTIISGALEQALEGIPFDRAVLEITEHSSADEYREVDRALRPLRERGLRVAVDETGGGLASLRYILQLSPDLIKLDKSVTRDIDSSSECRAVVSAVIRVARETGIHVVAEGVETPEELQALRALGVTEAQGYLLGRPAAPGGAAFAVP